MKKIISKLKEKGEKILARELTKVISATFKIKKIDIRKNEETPKECTKIYIFPRETLIENLQARSMRPHSLYRKQVIPVVLKKMNLPADTKVKWSQFAGCKCGCSPGFIVLDSAGKTVYVDIA